MRPQTFSRLASLFFGKRNRSCKTVPAADMVSAVPKRDRADETWLFEAEKPLFETRDEHRADMHMASVGFRGLRHKLSVMTDAMDANEAPIIVSGKLIEDDDLFDGGALEAPTVQDTTIGGESDFLFGDVAASSDEARYAA